LEKKRTIRFFALLYFLYIAGNSFWGYSVIYFREVGFDSSQIGYMNAVGNFIAMVALPFMGLISDRIRSPRTLVAVVACISVPLHLLFPAVGFTLGAAFIPMLILCVLSVLGRQTGNSMMDSWIGGELDRIDASFGTIRRFGSGSYVVISIFCSLMLGKVLPYWTCFLVISIMSIPIIFLTTGKLGKEMTKAAPKEKAAGTGMVLKYVFGNYYFLGYLFMVMAFDAFLGIVNLDMSYLMDYIGAAQEDVGYVGAVRACTEIVIMVIIARQKKLPPFWILLGISGMLIAAEHLLYASVTGLWGMLAVTLCSGVAGGFFYGIGANYVFKIVDHRASSTAMAVLGVVKSLIGIVSNAFGGEVIANHGVIALTNGIGIAAAALTLVFLVSCVLGRFVFKIPYVSEAQNNQPA
jgi:PPP family 3-phenylpropionic acid transporter